MPHPATSSSVPRDCAKATRLRGTRGGSSSRRADRNMGPMRTTMQDRPLLVRDIFRHGQQVHGLSQVVTFEGDDFRRASFAEVAERAERLAAALDRLGVGDGDRVATFLLEQPEHLEAYLARPEHGRGPAHPEPAALPRAAGLRDQPRRGQGHHRRRDRWRPLLARVLGDRRTRSSTSSWSATATRRRSGRPCATRSCSAPRSPASTGPTSTSATPRPCATRAAPPATRRASSTAIAPPTCTRSRSPRAADARHLRVGPGPVDRPHVPRQRLGHALRRVDDRRRPDHAADVPPGRAAGQASSRASGPPCRPAVPTIWNDLLRYAESHGSDLSSLRSIVCRRVRGAAVADGAVPRRVRRRMVQGWGMTETSPLVRGGAASAGPLRPTRRWTSGPRPAGSCRGRDPGRGRGRLRSLPNDGESVGEFEARGPWVTGCLLQRPDAGAVPRRLAAHRRRRHPRRPRATCRSPTAPRTSSSPAASGSPRSSWRTRSWPTRPWSRPRSSAVPDERWDERPLACVVLIEGAVASADELASWLGGQGRPLVAARALGVRRPRYPKTSVGKFDKKVLRAGHSKGELDIVTTERATR